jgi:hypothetical protein
MARNVILAQQRQKQKFQIPYQAGLRKEFQANLGSGLLAERGGDGGEELRGWGEVGSSGGRV